MPAARCTRVVRAMFAVEVVEMDVPTALQLGRHGDDALAYVG